MPHTDDIFRGHMFPGDPRNLMTVSSGCDWPTVPAFRYRVFGTDCTGGFFPFQFPGILIELRPLDLARQSGTWQWVPDGEAIDFFIARKVAKPNPLDGYLWDLTFRMEGSLLTFREQRDRPSERCNRSVLLGDITGGPSFPGHTGADWAMHQVKFDEEMPPASP